MKAIEVFIQLPNHEVAEIVEIEDDKEFGIIIQRLYPEQPDEVELFLEGENQPLHRQHRPHERGIKHHDRLHVRHKHHREVMVDVFINGKKRETHRGLNTVQHLKNLGEVPADEVLAQFIGGKFEDLKDDAKVEICGGEKFASHVKSAGSS